MSRGGINKNQIENFLKAAREVSLKVIEDTSNEKVAEGGRMEEELEDFLKLIGIPSKSIEQMKNEKIDVKTIKLMEPRDLEKCFPKIGDRYAVQAFCSQHISSLYSFLDKVPEGPRKVEGSKKIHLTWMNFEEENYVAVKESEGGGRREVLVQKDCTMMGILNLGKRLFFPGGQSKKGHESQFNFSLYDFKHTELIEPCTIDELCDRTGLARLKFYLYTTKKEHPSTIVSSDAKNEGDGNNATIIPKALPNEDFFMKMLHIITSDTTKTSTGATNDSLADNEDELQDSRPKKKPRIQEQTSEEVGNYVFDRINKIWLYIWGVKDHITDDILIKFLRKEGAKYVYVREIEVHDRRKDNKRFKIGLDYKMKKAAYHVNFWPEGVKVRKYEFEKEFYEKEYREKENYRDRHRYGDSQTSSSAFQHCHRPRDFN